MANIIKILHLEDNEEDAVLIHETINSNITFCRIKRVDNESDFEEALIKERYDLIISDFALPSFNGLEALKIARKLAPDIPYIYVSGHIGEDRAIEALRNGATDYVLKDKPAKLVPAILRAIKETEEREKRRKAEEALKESERFAISTVNAMSVQIAILNENGIILEANKSWKNQSIKNSPVPQGLASNENYLEHCRQKNNPEAIKFATGIMSVLNGYEKEYIQEYNCNFDNCNKWFQGRVTKFESEGPVRMVVVHVDITARRMATEQLKESEKRYRLFADNSTDIIATTDESGIFTYVSPVIERLLGYKPEEVIGKSFFELLHPDDLESIQSKRKIIIETQESFYITYRTRKKDGNYTWFESSSKKIIDKETGKIDTILSVSRDISERKKTELELLNAKEKAEEMNRLKTNFLSNMSHELRTPMIGILGFTEILHEEITDPEYRYMINTINSSANRLLNTLNLLLDLSRIESNNAEFNFRHLNISSSVQIITKSFEGAAKKKGLSLNLSILNNNVASKLDERIFEQIMNNLLNNAIKFTSKGSINVIVTSEIIDNKLWAVIKIADTGIGIPKDSLQIIFEEFRQVSEGLNRSYEGTGLGLTITKKTVELMNGIITVDSTLDVGSTFTVYFPATEINEIIHASDDIDTIQKTVPKTGKKINILLVENDKTNLEFMKMVLNKYYFIDSAEDGHSAINLVSQNKYDLIFMDIGLGLEMNGVQAASEIRKIPGYDKTPIVAVTAYAMKSDKEFFLSQDLTHYLSKPFTKNDLLNLTSEVLSSE
ncbi:MAG: response regulator [Bacteroidetes bacterium]|nr:response regulator [Bacteroidota bacterium]